MNDFLIFWLCGTCQLFLQYSFQCWCTHGWHIPPEKWKPCTLDLEIAKNNDLHSFCLPLYLLLAFLSQLTKMLFSAQIFVKSQCAHFVWYNDLPSKKLPAGRGAVWDIMGDRSVTVNVFTMCATWHQFGFKQAIVGQGSICTRRSGPACGACALAVLHLWRSRWSDGYVSFWWLICLWSSCWQWCFTFLL